MGDTIDYHAKVPDSIAACWAARVRDRAGVAVGLTTGAAVAVAASMAEELDISVVAIAPDAGWGFEETIDVMARRAAADGEAAPPVEVQPRVDVQYV